MIGIVFIGVMTALAVFASLAKHAQVGPKRRKSGKREKSSSSSWHYLTAKTAVRQSLLLPPEVALHPLQPDVLTRCERARLGSAIRSEGTPPSVPSPLFHSDQTGTMPKSKKKPANARMSCIKNAPAWMETQQMTGCKQSRKYCATKPERAPPRPNQFSRSSQLPAQRGCFPCRLENSGPAYRTKKINLFAQTELCRRCDG